MGANLREGKGRGRVFDSKNACIALRSSLHGEEDEDDDDDEEHGYKLTFRFVVFGMRY